jgi:hypothetical protein
MPSPITITRDGIEYTVTAWCETAPGERGFAFVMTPEDLEAAGYVPAETAEAVADDEEAGRIEAERRLEQLESDLAEARESIELTCAGFAEERERWVGTLRWIKRHLTEEYRLGMAPGGEQDQLVHDICSGLNSGRASLAALTRERDEQAALALRRLADTRLAQEQVAALTVKADRLASAYSAAASEADHARAEALSLRQCEAILTAKIGAYEELYKRCVAWGRGSYYTGGDRDFPNCPREGSFSSTGSPSSKKHRESCCASSRVSSRTRSRFESPLKKLGTRPTPAARGRLSRASEPYRSCTAATPA